MLVLGWNWESHLHPCPFGGLFPSVFVPCLAPVHLIFHNRDNVEWSEEQEASARSKVQENSSQLLPQDKQGTFGECPHASLGLCQEWNSLARATSENH